MLRHRCLIVIIITYLKRCCNAILSKNARFPYFLLFGGVNLYSSVHIAQEMLPIFVHNSVCLKKMR